MSAILHVLGLDDAGGSWYLLWSGIFADVTIFAAAIGFYWKHTCHVGRCWRIGRHPVEGTGYVVCRRHHPHDAPSHADVIAAHRAARG